MDSDIPWAMTIYGDSCEGSDLFNNVVRLGAEVEARLAKEGEGGNEAVY